MILTPCTKGKQSKTKQNKTEEDWTVLNCCFRSPCALYIHKITVWFLQMFLCWAGASARAACRAQAELCQALPSGTNLRALSKLVDASHSFLHGTEFDWSFLPFQPERIDPSASRQGYDVRSDVWSLGITLVSVWVQPSLHGTFPAGGLGFAAWWSWLVSNMLGAKPSSSAGKHLRVVMEEGTSWLRNCRTPFRADGSPEPLRIH